MTKKTAIPFALFVVLLVLCVVSSLFFESRFSVSAFSQKIYPVICIDAGHGGIDNGVYGITSGKAEAEINLEIAKLIKDKLVPLGIEPVLTRENADGLYGDTSKGFKRRDMEKRKEIALQSNSALIVSIHCNYNKNKAAKGINIYYNKSDELSCLFAEMLAVKLSDLSSKKVRLDAEKMYMTHNIGIPAVIIECGFLSNIEDESKLLDDRYLKRLAEAISLCIFELYSDN